MKEIKRKNHYSTVKKSGFLLEPEEIFLDAGIYHDALNPKAHLEKRLETRISQNVFFLIALLFLGGVFVVIGQAMHLQVFQHEKWFALAQKNKERVYPILASRGIIYDRNMIPLVQNEPSFDVVMIPELLPSDPVKRETISAVLKQTFSSSSEQITEAFLEAKKGFSEPVPLVLNIAHEQAVRMEALILDMPGIRVEKNTQRNYLFGPILSNVLGYTGRISKNDSAFEQGNFFPTDVVGKTGIEMSYDEKLRGTNGRRIFDVDSFGRIRNEIIVSESVAGKNIVTTIDSALQKKLYEEMGAMASNLGTKKGAAAVAIDPRNGEVLALVSWPGYDNNHFAGGISSKEYESLLNDQLQPLFNRPVSGQYPPGSSIKPFIAAAALEENIIDPKKEIFDKGYITVGNPYNPGNSAVFVDWKPHGWVDMERAIAMSANVYFYIIGGGYQDIAGLGINRIKQYAQLFGFGDETGVDIPAEVSGLLPDPDWKAQKKPYDKNWHLGDTYHVSIGQGDMLVTPLQLASGLSSIANGGTLYRPHMVREVTNEDVKIEPEIVRKDFIKPDNIEEVRKGMKATNSYGSARGMSALPFESGGKTGTAQYGPQNRYTHGWYSVFAPFENPEIALVILIEGGGEGSSVAVPIAQNVLKWYLTEQKTLAEVNKDDAHN